MNMDTDKSLPTESCGALGCSRRLALRLLIWGAGLVLLEACAPASAPGPTPTTSAAATSQPKPAAQPKDGGVLRSAVPAEIASLDPHLFAAGAAQTVWLVNERLTAYNLQLQPQPWLAESWEVTPDFKQITFHLRKGVTFHTGRELTGDDIKYNITRLKDPKVGAGVFVNQAKWFTSIETPDKYTVVMKSEEPRPLMFDFFERMYIADQATLEGPDAKSRAVGTGPFTFVEWVQGDHLTFSKNANYWQKGLPHLDSVQVRVLRDPQALVAQFEAGALDVVQSGLSLQEFARLKRDPSYKEFAGAISTGYSIVGMNTRKAPFDKKPVRQAMNLAMDRQRFVDTQLLGLSRPMYLPWQPSSPAYDASKKVEFNLEQARTLLQEAGASNLEADLLLGPGVDGPVFAQIYQSDLGKIGVKLNIQTLDLASWLDQVNNKKYAGLYWIGSASAASPGSELATSRGWDPLENNSGYANEEYTRLVNALVTETSSVKQKELYARVNDFLVDDPFAFPIAATVPTGLARSNVQGTTIRLLSGWAYVDAWLA